MNLLSRFLTQIRAILRSDPRMMKFSTQRVENLPHTVWKIGAAKTPRGFHIKAQGGAYPRYPGYGCIKNFNPNGVAHHLIMFNPVGVENLFSHQPRVARIRATLGSDIQPPWGCTM